MIEAKNIIKIYRSGEVENMVLRGIDLRIEDGEFVAIMGRSGAGKSTLLYQLSLLDSPTSGIITIDGRNVELLDNGERTQFRLMALGYVFQEYALLPELTALENVMVPLMMQGMQTAAAQEKSVKALAGVGLATHLDHLPSQLSGGEQQRVSIARAVAHNPKILFADEPTANLDSESAALVMNIFQQLHSAGQTIVMVTHELPYGQLADRIIRMEDGRILV